MKKIIAAICLAGALVSPAKAVVTVVQGSSFTYVIISTSLQPNTTGPWGINVGSGTLNDVSTQTHSGGNSWTGPSTFSVVNITSANVQNIGGTSISGMRNRIINGDMFFDQRNEALQAKQQASGSSSYGLDMWSTGGENSDGVYYALKTSTVSPPSPFNYAMRITVGTVDSSIGASQAYIIRQFIEGTYVRDFLWGTAQAQPVVLSFWSKTSFSGTFGGSLYNNAANRNYPFTYTNPSANVWTYQQIAIPGDTTGTWLTDNTIGVAVTFDLGTGSSFRSTANAWEAGIVFGVTGTASLISTAAATMDLTGVQLEIGTKPTAFEIRSYDEELRQCQRYFEKSYVVGSSTAGSPTNTGQMFGVSTSIAAAQAESQMFMFKVTKRSSPTILTYDVTAGASVSGKGRWYSTAGVGTQRTTSIDAQCITGFCITQSDNNTDAHCLFQWTADASQ